MLGREVGATEQVGLRPEHLVGADAASAVVEGRLELVENLGEYALVHLVTAAGVEFIAKTEKPLRPKRCHDWLYNQTRTRTLLRDRQWAARVGRFGF